MAIEFERHVAMRMYNAGCAETSEIREPKDGEWFLNSNGCPERCVGSTPLLGPRLILRKIGEPTRTDLKRLAELEERLKKAEEHNADREGAFGNLQSQLAQSQMDVKSLGDQLGCANAQMLLWKQREINFANQSTELERHRSVVVALKADLRQREDQIHKLTEQSRELNAINSHQAERIRGYEFAATSRTPKVNEDGTITYYGAEVVLQPFVAPDKSVLIRCTVNEDGKTGLLWKRFVTDQDGEKPASPATWKAPASLPDDLYVWDGNYLRRHNGSNAMTRDWLQRNYRDWKAPAIGTWRLKDGVGTMGS